MSQLFTGGGQSTGVSALPSFLPKKSQVDLLQNGLVGSPCSPRDSQESSPAPQFKSINPLVLSFLHSPTLTSIHVQFSSVQSLSHVRLFATPRIAARQASLSITNSQSSLRLTSIESVMPSSHLIVGHPLILLPPIPPSIKAFSNESTVRMRWPKY